MANLVVFVDHAPVGLVEPFFAPGHLFHHSGYPRAETPDSKIHYRKPAVTMVGRHNVMIIAQNSMIAKSNVGLV